MTRKELSNLYKKREIDFSTQLSKISSRILLISNLRLGVALLVLLTIYLTFAVHSFWSFGTFISIAIFFILVKKHSILFNLKTHLENLVWINTSEQKIINGDFSHLDPGKDFIDPQHAYTHDLDIFGEGSLFQYLNRCNTQKGRQQFADRLAFPFNSKKRITEQQAAIRELTNRINFRQHFQAAGMASGEQPGDAQNLLHWTNQPSIINTNGFLRFVLIVIPVLTIAAAVGTFINGNLSFLLSGLILTQWAITGFNLGKINEFHDYISKKKNILQRYAKLLRYIERESFNTKRLKEISTEAHNAEVNVARLASLVNALDARTNILASVFVNSFLMYDLQCVYRLEKWKETHAAKLPNWLQAISDIEEITSFATYAFNNEGFSYATISDELAVTATSLAHPLIDENERVASSLTIGPAPSAFIITGANMAGKSTFLRTVGVNLILALSGAPVCARSFSCPIIKLRTGMRTADSLHDHQSYFFAELNRLKTIMTELRENKPLLILLDEILKGTNSTDKQAGSMALVKQLLPHPCLAMIATHDLALGELENQYPDQIKNFCFEANIENDQLSFDYKLKTGMATKMNASFLMKKMGIIPDE